MIFSVSRAKNFISLTKAQLLLVTRHRLSCEKVNLHNTLVTRACDACGESYQNFSKIDIIKHQQEKVLSEQKRQRT